MRNKGDPSRVPEVKREAEGWRVADTELKRRTAGVTLLLLVVFALLLGRMWQLQIVQGEQYAQLADGNRLRRLATSAPRGKIFDRDGAVVADNRLVFTVSIVPGGLSSERDAVVQRLSEILGMAQEEIEEALQGRQRAYPYEPIRVLRDVPPDVVVAIEENRMDLPGVILEQEPIRHYTGGAAMTHILGYLLSASPEDLRAWDGYRPDDLVGKSGIERAYEEYLRGEHGFQQVEVNALSRAIRQLGSMPPMPGHDLVLTVDTDLQQATVEILEEQLARLAAADNRMRPPGGAAVVLLDVHTGAVLTVASVPTYDGNVFLTDGRSDYWRSLEEHPQSPMFNRALQGRYAPGSAFKPVTMLAALERGVTTPDEIYNATGSVEVSGTVFRDWTITQGLPPAGPVDAVAAMERSVNDYFYTMGMRAGIQAIADTARGLGLGRSSGLDIWPADVAGTVPDPAWKHNEYLEIWFPGDTVNVSIGQGYLQVTPMQMALLYMGLANRGTVYQPHLVQKVLSPAGEPVYEHAPTVLSSLSAAPEHWDTVRQGLRAVVSGSRGTARNAFRDFPVAVAGKTGSAQVGGNVETHAWFAAFAPYDEPEVAIAVLIEHGGGGGSAAAPVACRVLAEYFDLPWRGEDAVCP